MIPWEPKSNKIRIKVNVEHQSRSEEIGNALTKNVISKYCGPNYMIMDQDSAFMSSLMYYKKLTVKPYSHQLLQAGHEVKSLSTI